MRPTSSNLDWSRASFDGKLSLALGKKGSGKTTFCFDQQWPDIILAPGPTNIRFRHFDSVDDSPAGLKKAEKHGLEDLLIYVKYGNPDVFKLLEAREKKIMLDDLGKMMVHWQRQWEDWAREVRWRGQQVWASTHRPRKDLSPLGYEMCDDIYFVGWLKKPEEVELVHKLDECHDLSLEAFQEKISNQEFYDWKRKNVETAVMKIKST